MQYSDNIQSLFKRYLDNKAGSEEIDLLLKHFDAGTEELVLRKMILEQLELATETDEAWQYKLDETYQAIRYRMYNSPTVHRFHFLRKWGWAAAASIIMLFSVGAYLWIGKNSGPAPVVIGSAEILPGKEGAILTLADGSQVSLDSIQNGVIALQGGATAKVANGSLQYEGSGSEVVYNRMSTPKGRQFLVVLPDGTKVWLNAASSIRYPTVFAGNERKVEVTGEAYFEVAKNRKMPFRLSVNNKAEVEVLGTQFNVSAYENEQTINTTLIEGSVNVALSSSNIQHPTSNIILKPGQQAQLSDQLRIVDNANIEKVMSWKNGLFNFEGASLLEVMRQLERWYDIEVVYEKGIPNIEFEGKMTRDVSLNGLLIVLESSDVHFRIEGRKLIVLP